MKLGALVGTGRIIERKLKMFDDMSCVFWKLKELEWSHSSGLLFLQGASIQQIVNPYMVLRARPRPVYAVRPGIDDVLLVDLLRAPSMSQADLFVMLTAYAANI